VFVEGGMQKCCQTRSTTVKYLRHTIQKLSQKMENGPEDSDSRLLSNIHKFLTDQRTSHPST